MIEKLLRQRFCNDLDDPHEGFIIVEKDGKQFHALPSGEPIYAERYKRTEHFQKETSGLPTAWVEEEDGRWKKIDKNGKEVQTQSTSSAT